MAAGNHLAVWVDGYQVSDFIDTRPRGSNARTHLRLEAGPISPQGNGPLVSAPTDRTPAKAAVTGEFVRGK